MVVDRYEDKLEEIGILVGLVATRTPPEYLDRLGERRTLLLLSRRLEEILAGVARKEDYRNHHGVWLSLVIVHRFGAEFVVDAGVVFRVSLRVRVSKVDFLDRFTEAQAEVRRAVVDVELLHSLGGTGV